MAEAPSSDSQLHASLPKILGDGGVDSVTRAPWVLIGCWSCLPQGAVGSPLLVTWNSLPTSLEPSKEDTASAYCHVAYSSDPKNMPSWAQMGLYRGPGRRRGTWEHVKAFVLSLSAVAHSLTERKRAATVLKAKRPGCGD